MTEPVAYLNKYMDSSTNITRFKPKNHKLLSSTALYTAEQPHPRVKMTQIQYDRLIWDKNNNDLSICLEYFIEHDGVSKFGKMSDNLMGSLKQEDIARAWLNPEETIEIIPNMKWFVRSKEKDDGEYLYLKNSKESTILPWYTVYKDSARYFDTEDEAKLWENPLCEAVQLPVEVE